MLQVEHAALVDVLCDMEAKVPVCCCAETEVPALAQSESSEEMEDPSLVAPLR